MSRWFLGISGEGHSTISLGSSITCTAELFFFIFMCSFLTSVSYTGHFYLRLNLPSSLSLSWFERCSSPLIVFITLHWICSFVSVLRSPDPDTTLQMLLYQDWVDGQDHSPRPAVHALPNAAQNPLDSIGYQGTLLAHGPLDVLHDPRSFSTELLSSTSAPSLCWCMGLFYPRCRTLYLLLLNFRQFCWLSAAAHQITVFWI